MILITGTVRIRDGKRDDMLTAARAMIDATRAEPGCRAYRYAFDLDDALVVTFHEEWEDDAAVAAHFATPHMATFRAALRDILAEQPQMTAWAADLQPMPEL